MTLSPVAKSISGVDAVGLSEQALQNSRMPVAMSRKLLFIIVLLSWWVRVYCEKYQSPKPKALTEQAPEKIIAAEKIE